MQDSCNYRKTNKFLSCFGTVSLLQQMNIIFFFVYFGRSAPFVELTYLPSGIRGTGVDAIPLNFFLFVSAAVNLGCFVFVRHVMVAMTTNFLIAMASEMLKGSLASALFQSI